MSTRPDPILAAFPLGFQWPTEDPCLFCVHHDDAYPRGNDKLGPAASLAGRDLGQDFELRDGWRMYHGRVVPGFPQHPHRGFETVTLARNGHIDHSDSMGATARFGRGDVQWMTAGKGVVHCEMFPLLDPDGPNPVELFQIWLNLPSQDKFVEPHFAMLWSDTIPKFDVSDEAGRATSVTVMAGSLAGRTAPPPPPRSWAAKAENHVAIWNLRLSAGARFTLPSAPPGLNRMLYFFDGTSLVVDERLVDKHAGLKLLSDAELVLEAGEDGAEVLVLQGQPIGEPVAQHGPFVMNSRNEIMQAFEDYRRTGFGGWPWKSDGPVHPRGEGRFAKHADGKVERRD